MKYQVASTGPVCITCTIQSFAYQLLTLTPKGKHRTLLNPENATKRATQLRENQWPSSQTLWREDQIWFPYLCWGWWTALTKLHYDLWPSLGHECNHEPVTPKIRSPLIKLKHQTEMLWPLRQASPQDLIQPSLRRSGIKVQVMSNLGNGNTASQAKLLTPVPSLVL
jgi:hypothetical protein